MNDFKTFGHPLLRLCPHLSPNEAVEIGKKLGEPFLLEMTRLVYNSQQAKKRKEQALRNRFR